MINFDAKVENWKNKLLDMSKRNRLLNFRDTTMSSLVITSPSCESLFESFARQEKDLIFPLPPAEEEKKGNAGNAESPEIPEAPENASPAVPPEETMPAEGYGGIGSDVRTNKKIRDLQRVLRNLRYKAKIAIEEQGVNILYLSFGFLKWKDTNQSDQFFRAPLILVPVSLTWQSVTSPFVLRPHDDETVVNPTLCYKLQNEYGVVLPEFDETQPLEVFFGAIRDMVRAHGWDVEDTVGLCLLSFLKINMYMDLKNHADKLAENPIVRALCGDASALARLPEDPSGYDFDRNDRPEDVFQILDADSSQLEAIHLARKGVSFVLQGPPGTGKSQTITNIIAESLADGKKVLFVSEKMAALDVVHNRLARAGLDDFCLVLHSHKANKRSVLDQLAEVVQLSGRRATLTDEVTLRLQELTEDRKLLNEYAEQVYTPIEPMGKSIYDVNGILASLTEAPDVMFLFPGIRQTDAATWRSIQYHLDRLGHAITGMGDRFATNPWQGTKMDFVSGEFRSDLPVRLKNVPEKAARFKETFAAINAALGCDFPISLLGAKKAETAFAACADAREVPLSWLTDADAEQVEKEISACATLREESAKTFAGIRSLRDSLAQQGFSFDLDGEALPDEAQLQDNVCRLDILLSGAPYDRFGGENTQSVAALMYEAKENTGRIRDLERVLRADYEDSVFALDYEGIRARVKTEYTSVLRALKPEYREDVKTFRLCARQAGKKITPEEMLAVADRLKEREGLRKWLADHSAQLTAVFGEGADAPETDWTRHERELDIYRHLAAMKTAFADLQSKGDQLAAKEETLKALFGQLYKGLSTDWNEVRDAWRWACGAREAFASAGVNEAFASRVCASRAFALSCVESGKDLLRDHSALRGELDWFLSLFEDPEALEALPVDELLARVQKCESSLSELEEWLDYKATRKQCADFGLAGYISLAEETGLRGDQILPAFKKRFFRLWLDAVLEENPAVQRFRGVQQETMRSRFAELDKQQFTIARGRIKEKLINRLPDLNRFTTGDDELSILRRELAKQRKIMPVRRLFSAIPDLLLSLKPCLMMSPLTVSLFLEADAYQFDVVIFDEASQVYTENAIGAISRGRQVIITGDSKQLPPTNFFQAASDEGFDTEDEDAYDQYEVYDSVLDEANALPERTLSWHYRSRHESLIAFSNAKIYHNMLTTFPSNVERDESHGVNFIHVPNGFYDRGGKKGNFIEAAKIVELIYDHFRRYPTRSLGVIAFGEVQQNAIETALNEKRRVMPEFEKFFDESAEEPFFVKSLENVQGDERDTIIFSIGYARDIAGRLPTNFGPLGVTGGERRLNVAITRAKINILLVGSILPTDINPDAFRADGPKLLRAYMEYAIQGEGSLDALREKDDDIASDSPFERSVYNFLDRRGYKLSTQVGCSGYRIDMAVKHPTLKGIYVLGIECDGAAYHSARTARERDRLRQEVLEGMGWTIYHVWSTDWIKDPAAAGQKLLDAVENAIANYYVEEETPTAPAPEEAPTEEAPAGEDRYVSLAEKETAPQEDPYGFDSRPLLTTDDVLAMVKNGSRTEDYIREIVNRGYPIHFETVCQLMAPLCGSPKVTARVRSFVESGLYFLQHEVERKEDFLYPKGVTQIPVYLPNDRKIQLISQDELMTAMRRILACRVGFDRKGLADETTRVFGYARSGANISAAMNRAIDTLLASGEIEETDGRLRPVHA